MTPGALKITSFAVLVLLVAVSAQNCSVSTYVGILGSNAGFSGDGGDATSAMLSGPLYCVWVDQQKTVFVADIGNKRVRKVNPDTKIVTTIAGINSAGFFFLGIIAFLFWLFRIWDQFQ